MSAVVNPEAFGSGSVGFKGTAERAGGEMVACGEELKVDQSGEIT